jgi:cellulose synthase/poly-beta-1,6-N-acetylglucosamine synthase-like glycosyltransferase
MAFSRSGLNRIGVAAYGLAEDLELSWRLRLAGEHVHFVPQAIIRGAMVARSGKSATNQRLRWERGRAALRRQFRGLIWTAPKYSLGSRILATIDLYFPPLSALTFYFLISLALTVVAASKAGTVLVSVYGSIFTLYILAPFLLTILPWGYLKALVYAPVYMVWKFCLGFLPEPRQWVRTVRE